MNLSFASFLDRAAGCRKMENYKSLHSTVSIFKSHVFDLGNDYLLDVRLEKNIIMIISM